MIFVKLLIILILFRLKETHSIPGQQGMDPNDRPYLPTTTSETKVRRGDNLDSTKVVTTESNNANKTRWNLDLRKTQCRLTEHSKNDSGNYTERKLAIKRDNFPQAFMVFRVIFMVCGILLNVVNLIVNSKLESILFNIYVKSICIVDLLFLIVEAFNVLAFKSAYGENDSNLVIVKLWFYNTRGLILFHYTSALILLYIGIERAIRVNYPLKSRKWFSRTKAKFTVMTLCIIACILVTPMYL